MSSFLPTSYGLLGVLHVLLLAGVLPMWWAGLSEQRDVDAGLGSPRPALGTAHHSLFTALTVAIYLFGLLPALASLLLIINAVVALAMSMYPTHWVCNKLRCGDIFSSYACFCVCSPQCLLSKIQAQTPCHKLWHCHPADPPLSLPYQPSVAAQLRLSLSALLALLLPRSIMGDSDTPLP